MKTYKQYLQEQAYSETTITGNEKQVESFKKWCKRNHTTPIEIDYKTCLKFIKYLNRKGTAKQTVNHRVRSIKTYFNYLIDVAYRTDNPIDNIIIKGERRSINYNLLEADELEDLYYSFETENIKDKYHRLTAKRSKVITGLIVYQGLNTTSLNKLKTEHLQLNKGKIYVPSTRKSNARELELKPWQIMEFIEYQNEVLPLLQKRIKNYTDLLFPINTRFNVLTSQITKKLKKYNQKVENPKQIRASVITNWLGQYNLRKVQYLAGHRYISSTERYLQDDLENLHEMVNNFHPIS
ncbi:tyrosine-type recombinase/integrase [Seonamhaeicola sp.]|uniref:tyrosine-type recombinase/integrase n=1 Tax=Seonamhaeicola sp. TaxID=1912245 RepID=UPI0026259103|nr:tyrosine-type recombinase/integrase [Seonamhaeicola sp.]